MPDELEGRKFSQEERLELMREDFENPVRIVERVYQLCWNWADFHLFITSPIIPEITPPLIHEPELLPGTEEREFVYPIIDMGYKLSTSKAQEMFTAGMSMCKLYYTIEKMIFLLIERLRSGGIDEETEVQVAFAGHELAQRKAFESIINLKYNVIVNNFDPGAWGERYLAMVKKLADMGYGYPSESPRTIYKKSRATPTPSIKKGG